MGKKGSLYDRADSKLRRISGTIGAIMAIIGAATAVSSWVQSQFAVAISGQLDDFRQEVMDSNRRQDQAIARLELISLIKNDPTNVVAIEKMGKYYFGELGGNHYMTSMFSEWCNEYGADCSIVLTK